MATVSRTLLGTYRVLGSLISICAAVMLVCGILWIIDFNKIERVPLGRWSHLKSGHGLWSGALFAVGGLLGQVVYKHPTRPLLIGFLVMNCISTLVGFIEVGLLGDFLTSLVAKALDIECAALPADNPADDTICEFMGTLKGIAIGAGIGTCFTIGGICAAIVGLCTEQNTSTLINEEELPQPQGPVVMTQPGQFIAVQHTHVAQQYHPGSHVVTQNPPGQVSGHHIAATVPPEKNVPLPPAYTE